MSLWRLERWEPPCASTGSTTTRAPDGLHDFRGGARRGRAPRARVGGYLVAVRRCAPDGLHGFRGGVRRGRAPRPRGGAVLATTGTGRTPKPRGGTGATPRAPRCCGDWVLGWLPLRTARAPRLRGGTRREWAPHARGWLGARVGPASTCRNRARSEVPGGGAVVGPVVGPVVAPWWAQWWRRVTGQGAPGEIPGSTGRNVREAPGERGRCGNAREGGAASAAPPLVCTPA